MKEWDDWTPHPEFYEPPIRNVEENISNYSKVLAEIIGGQRMTYEELMMQRDKLFAALKVAAEELKAVQAADEARAAANGEEAPVYRGLPLIEKVIREAEWGSSDDTG